MYYKCIKSGSHGPQGPGPKQKRQNNQTYQEHKNMYQTYQDVPHKSEQNPCCQAWCALRNLFHRFQTSKNKIVCMIKQVYFYRCFWFWQMFLGFLQGNKGFGRHTRQNLYVSLQKTPNTFPKTLKTFPNIAKTLRTEKNNPKTKKPPNYTCVAGNPASNFLHKHNGTWYKK